jgi:general stress protein YciG
MNSVLDPNTQSATTASEEKREVSETTARVQPAGEPRPRRPRGFAAMDRTKVSEIASKGGKAAHAAGTAHQFTSDEARAAGRKGGVAPHVRRGRGPRQPAAPVVPPAPESKAAN